MPEIRKNRPDFLPENARLAVGIEAEPVLKAIRRITHAVDRRSKRVARITGLTIPQFVILKAIRDLGEVPTNRLSAHVDLTPGTVITILDRLEEKGWIQRRRSTSDRRVVYTRLTPRGEAIVSEAPALLNDGVIDAFVRMPEARRTRIVAALNEVADLFDAANEKRSAGAPPERSARLTLRADESLPAYLKHQPQ